MRTNWVRFAFKPYLINSGESPRSTTSLYPLGCESLPALLDFIRPAGIRGRFDAVHSEPETVEKRFMPRPSADEVAHGLDFRDAQASPKILLLHW